MSVTLTWGITGKGYLQIAGGILVMVLTVGGYSGFGCDIFYWEVVLTCT